MKYVISGAAGFIGSHLCDRLIEAGHQVLALDNLITGNVRNIQHLLTNKGFTYVEFDVCRPLDIAELEGSPVDRVFHLASLASPVDYLKHPLETLESGSTATRNMLELARKHNARFLLTSTSECYGDPLEHPQKETYWGNVNPVGLRSCYDESKRYAEAITMAYHRVYGVKSNIARIFNTYGPRMALNDGRVVPAFIDQALRGANLTVFGNGSQTRSFCYVSDLVEGLLRLSESDERYPVNLGNPTEMTIRQFADEIRARFGGHLEIEEKPLPSDDPKVRRPDITKARQLLGWEPKVPLNEGLGTTIDYFRNLPRQTPGVEPSSRAPVLPDPGIESPGRRRSLNLCAIGFRARVHCAPGRRFAENGACLGSRRDRKRSDHRNCENSRHRSKVVSVVFAQSRDQIREPRLTDRIDGQDDGHSASETCSIRTVRRPSTGSACNPRPWKIRTPPRRCTTKPAGQG